MKTTPDQNKALVLEAFDTLFNKSDYAKAAEFWSENYIQHSAHIKPGPRWPVRSDPELAGDVEIRAGHDRCRRRLRDCPRPVFRDWPARVGSPPISSVWPMVCSLNALGRFAGRSNEGGSRSGLPMFRSKFPG